MLMSDSRTDTSISDNDENTVLHVALKLGHYNLIKMMLPRAKDLTRQDASGCSVIIEAIKNQLEDLALDMLQACPSLVHTATHDLVTPLHLAAERGMTHLTKQLLIAGAQVDATDATGLTPSLYCAKNDSVLECLAMIEDIMMIADTSVDEQQQQPHVKGNKISSRISS
uniref:Serine/threonine-protein phosphatase 6 regulatory ankyrin repeat subunit A n=2 Tax=Aceria tosichella TaxID=561515 RepID=A0A6G1SRJ3_9ACAR